MARLSQVGNASVDKGPKSQSISHGHSQVPEAGVQSSHPTRKRRFRGICTLKDFCWCMHQIANKEQPEWEKLDGRVFSPENNHCLQSVKPERLTLSLEHLTSLSRVLGV